MRWGPRLIDGEASFFSISGDGRVVQWAVMPGELQATTIITLTSDVPPIPGPDGTMINVNSKHLTVSDLASLSIIMRKHQLAGEIL